MWSRERHSWINRGEERVIVSHGSHIYRTSTAGQHRAELCRWRLGSSAADQCEVLLGMVAPAVNTAPPFLDRSCGRRQWTDTTLGGGGGGVRFEEERKAGRGGGGGWGAGQCQQRLFLGKQTLG